MGCILDGIERYLEQQKKFREVMKQPNKDKSKEDGRKVKSSPSKIS